MEDNREDMERVKISRMRLLNILESGIFEIFGIFLIK